jgi:hypothetical protein
MQTSDLRCIDPRFAPFVSAHRFSSFDTLSLPFFDEAPFHLCDHAKHSKYDMSHFAACRYMRVKYGHKRATVLALMNNIEDVSSITPQPVKPCNHKLVTLPQKLDDCRQLSAPLAAAAGNLFRADNLATFASQALLLKLQILINGADACVTDASHM